MRYYVLFLVVAMLSFAMPVAAEDSLDSLLGDIDIIAPPEPEKKDEEEIPPIYLNEAEQFYQYCETERRFKTHYDCDCLAAHFLDKRIELGAKKPRRAIMKEIRKKCIDASEEAYNLYQQCKGNTLLLPKNIPAEVYCTCYGNEYAKMYEERKLVVSSAMAVGVQSKAHSKCMKGSYAESTYGAGATAK